jgi:hypothetical protein
LQIGFICSLTFASLKCQTADQFELELSGNEISNSFTGEKSINGFISMKKKNPVVFLFSGKETNKKVVLQNWALLSQKKQRPSFQMILN